MRIAIALVGALALLAAHPAAAEFPDKPIKIMAPYAPGGNIDELRVMRLSPVHHSSSLSRRRGYQTAPDR